jgi:hypothetical protein
MKKLYLIIAMIVALGLVVGLCADPASAFFGKFGKFGGGAKAGFYTGYAPYGCYHPCYAPYWCSYPGYYGPRYKMKTWRRSKAMKK